jgi:CDP-diacylglycerol pyrophosphatase
VGPTGVRRFLAASTLAVLAIFAATSGEARAAGGKCAGRESNPDCVLYLLARKCIDTSAPDYCTACPSPRAGYCPSPATCDTTTEVWTGTTRYVAIRDKTMCSCPDVVHGLVMPLGAVSGIEDPDRPPSIWSFAWSVSKAAGFAEEQTVLIANPPDHRSQSQLHIHVLPIDPAKSGPLETTVMAEVWDLNGVWQSADVLAAAKGLKSYGILVHKSAEGWHVHLEDRELTAAYTLLPTCSWPNRKR